LPVEGIPVVGALRGLLVKAVLGNTGLLLENHNHITPSKLEEAQFVSLLDGVALVRIRVGRGRDSELYRRHLSHADRKYFFEKSQQKYYLYVNHKV